MATITHIIERLEEKVKTLVAQNQTLKAELQKANTANETLIKQLEEQQQQFKKVAASNGINSEEELKKAKQLEKQLNQYIQDIDRCIEWLEYN